MALTLFPSTGCEKQRPREGKVVGSSMSPTILGEHYLAPCGECRYSLKCDIEQAEKRQHLVCSNCGGKIELSSCVKQPADSVDIQLSQAPIARWDVVAFHLPDDSNPDGDRSAGIKRVVGLPGESIELRNGNVFVDDHIARKNIIQQRAMRIPVHDSFYRSDRNWELPVESAWRVDSSFEFSPPDDGKAVQWFRFLNQRNYSHSEETALSTQPFPLEDFYAFNQSLSRDLNQIDEVFVAMNARISPGGTLAWRFDRRGTIYEFQIDSLQSQLNVSCTSAEFATSTVTLDPIQSSINSTLVEFSSFDLQFLVWVNGKEVFRLELPESEEPVSSWPLMFGAANNRLVFDRIQIWRDLYYFSDSPTDSLKSYALSKDGYFVIGDNVPISIDSRHWKTPSLLRNAIIGKVILP